MHCRLGQYWSDPWRTAHSAWCWFTAYCWPLGFLQTTRLCLELWPIPCHYCKYRCWTARVLFRFRKYVVKANMALLRTSSRIFGLATPTCWALALVHQSCILVDLWTDSRQLHYPVWWKGLFIGEDYHVQPPGRFPLLIRDCTRYFDLVKGVMSYVGNVEI